MDTIQVLGSAMGLGLLAGIRLYATVFIAGLAIRFGWFDLNPAMQHLSVLAEWPVLTLSGVAMVIEFLADKIPWIDSIWDSVHTFIRPVGAAVLGFAAIGNLHPMMQVLAGLLAGGVAFTGHSSKAAARLAVNHSPEPASNWVLSVAEDLAIPVGLWIVFDHPRVAIAITTFVAVLFLWLSPKVFRMLKVSRVALRSLCRRWFGSAQTFVAPSIPPNVAMDETTRRMIAELPFEPVPEMYARKVASTAKGEIRSGIHCAGTRSIRGLNDSTGYLCVVSDQLVFVTRRGFRLRTFPIPLTAVEKIQVLKGIFVDSLFVKTKTDEFQFDVFKAPRRADAPTGRLASQTH